MAECFSVDCDDRPIHLLCRVFFLLPNRSSTLEGNGFDNEAGFIQHVTVYQVRVIQECAHFSLAENIWSSPLLTRLKVEWLC